MRMKRHRTRDSLIFALTVSTLMTISGGFGWFREVPVPPSELWLKWPFSVIGLFLVSRFWPLRWDLHYRLLNSKYPKGDYPTSRATQSTSPSAREQSDWPDLEARTRAIFGDRIISPAADVVIEDHGKR